MYFLRRFLVIALIQLIIFSFIFTLFVFSFNQRREVSKNQSKALASIIAEQASNYFEENNRNFSSNDFFNFLDNQIGVQKLTNAFNVNPPEILTIYFRTDIIKGNVDAGTDSRLNKDDNSPLNRSNKFFFNNKYVAIKPFFVGTSDTPYGVVRIETSNIPILTEVLYNNGIFYMLLFLILNNQAFLFYLWMRKKRSLDVDTGYLKESSLGSIKIMHKLLSDVIEDHKSSVTNKDNPNNVLSIDDKK
mgnify:FL=1|jgi:hypothetical protein|tara:strand:- start:69 stop:806 length:738 start_codon:yes stop_codon:yes gene_type:complete